MAEKRIKAAIIMTRTFLKLNFLFVIIITSFYKDNQKQGVEYYIERSAYKIIKCYCTKMFKTTYNVGNLPDEIQIIDFDYVIECEGKGE